MNFQSRISQHIQKIINDTIEEISSQRSSALAEIPKFSFNKIHCEEAKLVQNRSELIKKMPFEAIVAEIGADEGKFSEEIVKVTNPKKFVIIDAWNTERYGKKKFINVKEKFEDKIIVGEVEIVRSLSLPAAERFDDKYFDWIYIDTDHSYKTTIAELYAYEKKIKEGGFICGHDYVMGNWLTGYKYGVIEAVAEFCVKKNWKISYLTADYTENNSFAISKI
jgi:hypothetical protein